MEKCRGKIGEEIKYTRRDQKGKRGGNNCKDSLTGLFLPLILLAVNRVTVT